MLTSCLAPRVAPVRSLFTVSRKLERLILFREAILHEIKDFGKRRQIRSPAGGEGEYLNCSVGTHADLAVLCQPYGLYGLLNTQQNGCHPEERSELRILPVINDNKERWSDSEHTHLASDSTAGRFRMTPCR